MQWVVRSPFRVSGIEEDHYGTGREAYSFFVSGEMD